MFIYFSITLSIIYINLSTVSYCLYLIETHASNTIKLLQVHDYTLESLITFFAVMHFMLPLIFFFVSFKTQSFQSGLYIYPLCFHITLSSQIIKASHSRLYLLLLYFSSLLPPLAYEHLGFMPCRYVLSMLIT